MRRACSRSVPCDARRMDDLRPVPKHELVFDIEHALGKARGLWPGLRGGGSDSLRLVANAVVEHLEL